MGLLDNMKEMLNGQLGTNAPNSSSSKQNQDTTNQAVDSQAGGGLYDSRMEQLIDMALADGELTEKEKQVLFKRAESMGIDLDEFEMVLDARLYKAGQHNLTQNNAVSAPKSDKYGDVRKCPACGAMIESFTLRCTECGYEFRNVECLSSVQSFFKKMEEIDNEQNAGGVLGSLGAVSSALGWGLDRKTKQKATLIANFPIPNTKEDILEFLSLAIPYAKHIGYFQKMKGDFSPEMLALQPVWKRKCENIIMKAKLSMKDDKQSLEMIAEYAKELKIKM